MPRKTAQEMALDYEGKADEKLFLLMIIATGADIGRTEGERRWRFDTGYVAARCGCGMTAKRAAEIIGTLRERRILEGPQGADWTLYPEAAR